jgi:photosystem II stability/assembly factor-like uncharacterized protein
VCSARAVRAIALMALAVVALGVTVAVYLRPQVPAPQAHPPPQVARVEPPQGGVTSADFVSGQEGWVAAVSRSAPGGILHTRDGGRHWAGSPQLTGVFPFWLRFFDSNRGLAMVGPGGSFAGAGTGWQLYSTLDGGARWTVLPLPEAAPEAGVFIGPRWASFPDPEHGWYLVNGSAGLASQKFDLYRTDDGGGSWSLVAAVDAPDQPESGGLGPGAITGMWFRDAKTGWVAQQTPGQPGGSAALYRSADGGLSWQRQELPRPPGTRPYLLWVAPLQFLAGEGAALAASYSGTESPAYAYMSTDGGMTWAAPRPLPRAPTQSLLPVTTVAFVDSRRWLAGLGQVLWATQDAGVHWHQVAKLAQGSVFVSIRPFESGRVWAVVQNLQECLRTGTCAIGQSPMAGPTLLASRDGGAHWSQVEPAW